MTWERVSRRSTAKWTNVGIANLSAREVEIRLDRLGDERSEREPREERAEEADCERSINLFTKRNVRQARWKLMP